MIKIRTYKRFTLTYELTAENNAYLISITRSESDGTERSSFYVHGDERELKALLCRMWGCSVTPLSLKYILQDEGFLPIAIETRERPIVIQPTIKKRLPLSEVADSDLVTALTGK